MDVLRLPAAILLTLCLVCPAACQQTDAVSREFSVYVYDGSGSGTNDTVGREFSVFAYDDTAAQTTDAVSREFGVYVGLVSVCVARQWYTGRKIFIRPAVVTAKFRGSLYVESLDRVAGILVKWTGSVEVGALVEVGGFTDLAANGERCILAESVVVVGSGSVAPLGIRPGAIGGGDYFYSEAMSAGQIGLHAWNWSLGVPEGIMGLNNLGLLITTWGRVTWSSTGSFILDDGSGFLSGDPTAPGVKVQLPFGVNAPPLEKVVCVTGISSCYKSGDLLYRLILTRSADDIRY